MRLPVVLVASVAVIAVGGLASPAAAATQCYFERGTSACHTLTEEFDRTEVRDMGFGCIETVTFTRQTHTLERHRGQAHSNGKTLYSWTDSGGQGGWADVECVEQGFEYMTEVNGTPLAEGTWGVHFFAHGFEPGAPLDVTVTLRQSDRDVELNRTQSASHDFAYSGDFLPGGWSFGQYGLVCGTDEAITFDVSDGTTRRTLTIEADTTPIC